MKTAVVCWCLFGITFASAFPSQHSPHANALEKSRIKEDSRSLDVNYNTEAQRDSHSSDVKNTEKKNFFLDLRKIKEQRKELLVSPIQTARLDAQDNFFRDVNDDTEQQQDSRSSRMNPHAVTVEQTFALFEMNDRSDDRVTIDDNSEDQNNQIFDERYAENDPEIIDEFLDDYRSDRMNYPMTTHRMISSIWTDTEDSSVEIE